MRFTLRQLELYIALSEMQQISKAAAHCHISQAAMTIAMRNLETAVNAQLFIRHAKGICLTPVGERFLIHAKKIVTQSYNAAEDIQRIPQMYTGTLTIGVAETLSAYLIPRIIHDIEQHFPLMKILFKENTIPALLSDIRSQSVDFCLMLTSNISAHPDLITETFMRSARRLWAEAGHPLLSKPDLFLKDVEEFPFILLSTDEYPGVINEYWKGHGSGPNVFFTTNSFEAVRSLVAQGKGVTILSDLVYRPWSLEGLRIMRRTIENSVTYMDIGIVRRSDILLSSDMICVINLISQLCIRLHEHG